MSWNLIYGFRCVWYYLLDSVNYVQKNTRAFLLSSKLLGPNQILYHLNIVVELLPSGLVYQNVFDFSPIPLSLFKSFPILFYVQILLTILYFFVILLFLFQVIIIRFWKLKEKFSLPNFWLWNQLFFIWLFFLFFMI